MSSRTKKVVLIFVALFGLTALGLYVVFGCPSLWARDFAVDPAANAHLVAINGLTAENAALEFIDWNIPVYDRVPRERISLSSSQGSSDAPVVRIYCPEQDDSIHCSFYEITLSRQQETWTVTRLRRCWTGRGLIGWSTSTPS